MVISESFANVVRIPFVSSLSLDGLFKRRYVAAVRSVAVVSQPAEMKLSEVTWSSAMEKHSGVSISFSA
jgi:hypothetical protein